MVLFFLAGVDASAKITVQPLRMLTASLQIPQYA